MPRVHRSPAFHPARPATMLAMAALTAVLGTATLAATPASAQVFYRQWSYYGAPYQRPPAYVRPAPLPLGEIVDILADDHRYRRIGHPQFAGHMYVVDGIDRNGARVRSYVDAFNGRLIDVDVIEPARRQVGPGPRIARLPEPADSARVTPAPPRKPAETRREQLAPERQAARPSAATPAAPATTLPTTTSRPSASPIVPLSREPRVVDPSAVRLPDEADKAPPMARPTQPMTSPAPTQAPALVAPPQAATPLPAVPRAAAPPSGQARPAPGASQVAPAPLDDAARRNDSPAAPAVPAAPLL